MSKNKEKLRSNNIKYALFILVLFTIIILYYNKAMFTNIDVIETKSGSVEKQIKDNIEVNNNSENEGDSSFGAPLQEFIKDIMKNPDILIKEDCSIYKKEVIEFCEREKEKYLKTIKK